MAGDPETLLPPTNEPPTPELVRAPGSLARPTCEFCECKLTHTGEILQRSDKAKRFQKHDETIEKANEKIAALETEARELRAKLEELTPKQRRDLGLEF